MTHFPQGFTKHGAMAKKFGGTDRIFVIKVTDSGCRRCVHSYLGMS